EADEIIDKEQKGKNLKYKYTVNYNILIGNLKNHLICLVLEKSPRRRKKLYKQILNDIKRERIPIRPARSFPRAKGLRANKNGLMQKSAL
ncbi:IS4/IS5 family transposase, partial [Butyricicoccus sp. 1XD8-22]